MRRFSATAVVESSSVSNRRQPVRQTRTNPPRGVANVAQPQTPAGTSKSAGQNANPGFYPAITHFTDSITALPKELIRNYTMLKEVDAKIHGPEEILGQLVRGVLSAPLPHHKATTLTHNQESIRPHNENAANFQLREMARSPTSAPDEGLNLPRRQMVINLRMVMNEMFTTLDEKNHVISNAVDELNKQLARCDSSFAHIPKEISEEARHGSLNHWAYTEKAAEKKGTLAGERTRRDNLGNNPANLGVNQETEGFASRSEMRREALAAKKRPHIHLDSDFDDGRSLTQTASRKVQTNGKSRKPPDPPMIINNVAVGLGIANGTSSAPPASKRRKMEKSTMIMPISIVPVERAMSSVFGTNAVSARGGAGSPRDTPAVEFAKKKGRVTTRVNGSTRQRANTNNSATNSPMIASSPIASSFPVIKDIHRKSPPSSIVQRAQPSRSRQNSAQTLPPDARNGASSSTLNKAPNKNGTHCEVLDGGKVPSTAGRSIAELKTAMKESLTLKSEHQAEEPLYIDGIRDVRSAGAVSSGRTIERALKREESENSTSKTRPDRPPSISISARGAGKSKPSGPQSATASEPPPPRSRASRTIEPPPIKRSHKKGAGQAAQLEREAAAAAAARANHHDEETSSVQGEEEEEEEEGEEELDGSEPRYCYCDGVSYGEMVACDMPDCKREWFHLGCVGLAKAPTKNAKWFCNDCLEDKASKFPPSPTTIVAAATATITSPITAGGR